MKSKKPGPSTRRNSTKTKSTKHVVSKPKQTIEKSDDPKTTLIPTAMALVVEAAVERVEKATESLIGTANQLMAMTPNPKNELSRKALSLSEKNIKAALEHTKRLVHAKNMLEVIQIHGDFLKDQLVEQLKEFAGSTPAEITKRDADEP
jgi:hypothetical protein